MIDKLLEKYTSTINLNKLVQKDQSVAETMMNDLQAIDKMLKPNESIEQQRKFLQILVNHFLSKKDRDSSEFQGIE